MNSCCRLLFSWAVIAILAGITLCGSSAEAQQRNKQKQPPQGQQPTKLPVEIDGKFVSMIQGAGGYIVEVETLVGEKWKCLVTGQTEVVAEGVAGAEFLKQGAYVSFDATVKLKKAAIEEPITAVTLFSPDPKRQIVPGVFQAWAAPELSGSRAEKKHGGGGAGGFSFGPESGDTGKGKKPQKMPETMDLTFRGMVASINKVGLASVKFPQNPFINGQVKCKFAPEVTINAVLSGSMALKFLKPGDKITVSGNRRSVNVTNMEVNSMEIEYAGVMEMPGKKKPAVKKPAADDDEDDDSEIVPKGKSGGKAPAKKAPAPKKNAGKKPLEDEDDE